MSAASAGTVMVRTTTVSINRPTPMMKPVCTMARLPEFVGIFRGRAERLSW